MAETVKIGEFSVKTREIGNGYLSNDGYDDFYFPTMDKCIGEFVNDEMPKQIVLGDIESARDSNKLFSWEDVLHMIRQGHENIGNIDVQLDIKVTATVHEE